MLNSKFLKRLFVAFEGEKFYIVGQVTKSGLGDDCVQVGFPLAKEN